VIRFFQFVAKAGLLLNIVSASTILAASFYNLSGSLQSLKSDEDLAKVPLGATVFFIQNDLSGSPAALSRRVSALQRKHSMTDLPALPVPSEPQQLTEEEDLMINNLDTFVQQFADSLGGLATDPNWRAFIRKVSMAISRSIAKESGIAGDLEGLITAEGIMRKSEFGCHGDMPTDTRTGANETHVTSIRHGGPEASEHFAGHGCTGSVRAALFE
jgi:hypothetical protein